MAQAGQTDAQIERHKRAVMRFDAIWQAQAEMRANSLAARRFIAIPGAMWEGSWGEQFENSIRIEIPKIGRAVRKIETDYRENRIEPDFRPDGPEADETTAATLDGIRRADAYRFKAGQARDNAFLEAVRGGFGAYRLANVLEDELDKDNDDQRINPGIIIPDADQRVFFDLASVSYDKSDARFAFVLQAWTPEGFRDEWGAEAHDSWPISHWRPVFDWFRPSLVFTTEYYEVETATEQLHVLTRAITDEEERYWHSEISEDALAERRRAGWSVKTQRRSRKRVHKYILSGSEELEDCGRIAGDAIPVVPVYGQREFVDGMERWKGHVQDRMDAQRLYNSNVSRLAEINARAPSDIPIFAPEQMPPHLGAQWARADIDRLAFLLAEPLRNASGEIVATGPIASRPAAQVPQVAAALLQISNADLTEEDQDGAGEVRANTSVDAMEVAAARVDAKSGIYLDNMRQSVQREGEIYLAMAREVYAEPGRSLDTMAEDGGSGTIEIAQEVVSDGVAKVVNDFAQGRYKVLADVSEATATRRDKTVRQALSMATIALQAQDTDLATACIVTAIMNTDGEGIDDLHRFARTKGLNIGLVEPNEEERQQADTAAQGQPPDATAALLAAQAEELKTKAARNIADAAKTASEKLLTDARIDKTHADTVKTLADAHATASGARVDELRAANDAAQPRPIIRLGREL